MGSWDELGTRDKLKKSMFLWAFLLRGDATLILYLCRFIPSTRLLIELLGFNLYQEINDFILIYI